MPNIRNKRRDNGFYSGHNEHDDRTQGEGRYSGGRRVSFKNNGGGGGRRRGYRQKGWDEKIRSHLQDEDIEMTAVRNSLKRVKKFPQKMGQRYMLVENPSNWYKVMIRCGHKYDQEQLLKILANFIKPIPLLPYGFKSTREETSFIVEEHLTAEELLKASRKISMADGWKLVINVRAMTQYIEVDDKLTAIIKKAMSERYNAYNKSLSLSKFHSDPNLLLEGVFVPLNKPNVMIAVAGIIGEVIPDIQALDLSFNNLYAIEYLKILLDKAPHIKSLNLGGNKLRELQQLDALKGLPLEELNLDGNSLCDKFCDTDLYIREVRKRFPKVIKLDNVDLPPPILFGTEDEGQIPSSKASFMCDTNGASVVRQFLEQYYQLYDSPDAMGRAPLAQAYHPNAVFSLDCYYHPSESHGTMSAYMPVSRNLFRTSSNDSRQRLLKVGQQNVIEAITSLPKTTHDPASFTVDLILFTPQLMEVMVCGVWRENTNNKKQYTRYFNRVFLIVPVGSGFCIINDQLTILSATQEQAKKAFKERTPVPATVAQPQPGVAPPVVLPPTPDQDLIAKQQMVTELSAKSGMNLVWAEKCLLETHWNFDQAVFAFTELQKRGTIPPEAFVK